MSSEQQREPLVADSEQRFQPSAGNGPVPTEFERGCWCSSGKHRGWCDGKHHERMRQCPHEERVRGADGREFCTVCRWHFKVPVLTNGQPDIMDCGTP